LDRMKIAIDVRKIEDFGIGTHIWNMLKSLSKIDRENEYFLIGFSPSSLPPLGKNFNFVRTKAKKYSISEHIKIPILLREIKCDIFHSPHYVVPFFYKGLTTATIHDVIHLLFPSYLPLKILRYYAYFQIMRTLKVSKIAFTVSFSSKKDIIRFFPWAEKKIEVIYNGVDERFFERAKAEICEKYKKELGNYILYVGNIKPHKNIGILLKGIRKLKGVKLVIAGSSPDNNILERIEREGLEGKVVFMGFLPFEELSALYESSQVFVFPSFYEGFGLPPLEAMAKGVPVVSSSAPSMPEILKNGAVYFDPDSEDSLIEAIVSVMENKDLRERITMEGRNVAQSYKWSDSATKILNCWRIINESCPRS